MRLGEVVGGRYRLDRAAGSGAMGLVYQGTDVAAGTPVAIKTLLRADATRQARFKRETQVLAHLRHASIVAYFDDGKTAEGEPFLVMEWLDGECLKSRLERGPLAIADVVDVGLGIAGALGAAHAVGVIHRDVKPANVFLPASGDLSRLKVTDFGIAHLRGDGEALTSAGERMGTPAYMAPEQARATGAIDHRCDLFSLGAVLFRCLAQRLPFDAPDAVSMLLKLATERPPPLSSVAPHVPASLARLVDALLAIDPDARPAEARLVYAALQAVRTEVRGVNALATHALGAPPPGHDTPTPHAAASHAQGSPAPHASGVNTTFQPVAAGSSNAAHARGVPSRSSTRGGLLVGLGVVAAAGIAAAVYFNVRTDAPSGAGSTKVVATARGATDAAIAAPTASNASSSPIAPGATSDALSSSSAASGSPGAANGSPSQAGSTAVGSAGSSTPTSPTSTAPTSPSPTSTTPTAPAKPTSPPVGMTPQERRTWQAECIRERRPNCDLPK